MHQTPHHISDKKSESFREHPLALETVDNFHFLSQHNFFQINCHFLVLSFAIIFQIFFNKVGVFTPFTSFLLKYTKK